MLSIDVQFFGGRGSGGGKGSSGGGGGKSINASTQAGLEKAVSTVSELKKGSEIQVTYGPEGEYTDTFRLQTKTYALGTETAWVNTTNNGYMNDFARNTGTLRSELRNKTVKVTKRS
jgi:hypothetical protein